MDRGDKLNVSKFSCKLPYVAVIFKYDSGSAHLFPPEKFCVRTW